MLTIDETRDPAEDHPDDWTEDNSSEIWWLIHVICIWGFIQENTCNNLAVINERKIRKWLENPYMVHSKKFGETKQQTGIPR